MTKTAIASTIVLLITNQVKAAASPTRTSTATNFPKWNNANALTIAATANGFAADATDVDGDLYLTSNTVATGNTANSVAILGGSYSQYRMHDTVVYIPQNLNTNEADGLKPIEVTTMGAAGNISLYMTDGSKAQTYAAKNPDIASGDAAGYLTTRALYSKVSWGSCKTSKVGIALDDAPKGLAAGIPCGSLVAYQATTDLTTGNRKFSFAKQRMVFASSTYGTKTQLGPISSVVPGADPNNAISAAKHDPDVLLGTFYQRNGDATDGTAWCDNGSTGTAAQKMAFSSEMASGTTLTLKANDGIGPRTKCTWQVTAPSSLNGTMAPVLSLDLAPTSLFLFQVIEWVDSSAFGTDSLIDKAKSFIGTSMISQDGTDYDAGKGVFLNPMVEGDAGVVTSLPDSVHKWSPYNQGDSTAWEAGSIGNIVYYDRDLGASQDLERSTDSNTLLKHVRGAWKTVTDGYDSAVTAYETAKVTYEKEPTTANIPDKPTSLPAYAGLNLVWLKDGATATQTASAWTALKTSAVAADQNKAYIASMNTNGVWSFDATQMTSHYPNRYSYLVASGTAAAVTSTEAGQVSHAFGRLGQAPGLGVAANTIAPFIWADPTDLTGKAPGMNISVFPEVAATGAPAYTKWATSSITTITTKLQTVASASDIAMPVTTKSPTAISVTATTGAQALAASVMASAAIAATLF